MTSDRPASSLPLDELRAERARLQRTEDAVSYARRIAQTRLDIVRARVEGLDGLEGRAGDQPTDGPLADSGQLRDVLSHQLLSPSGRPPRDTDAQDAQPAAELDALCAEHGFSRLHELGGDELGRLAEVLQAFEQRLSAQRRQLFTELDALSADLVRRYRDGSADVDALWDDARGR